MESDDGTRVVATGDIDLTTFGPYYGDASSSLEAFEATLEMMRDLRADHYVTFHHKGVIDGHEAFAAAIDQYAAVFGRRQQSLLVAPRRAAHVRRAGRAGHRVPGRHPAAVVR